MKYIVCVMRHMSYKTIWNTFLFCDNYSMPGLHPRELADIFRTLLN